MDTAILDLTARLLAAAACGALLGIDRDMADKPLGARTLGLVSLGSAVAAVAMLQVPGIAENSDAKSRVLQGIIQGIMGGISFIGAGVVFRDSKTKSVEGLTTAATVWVAAALGIACAVGAWSVVVVGAVIALTLLPLASWATGALKGSDTPERDPTTDPTHTHDTNERPR